ncbi:dolichyl-phosphate-mannose--protein mannosyltransferase [Dietzia sp.]|uniref:dolichyl-phosphate-mannose--protein mannosyltransferase n=1 Tax=Dietzia sp. TaxID=1871616 RepID=UPI002FDB140F
MKSSHDAAAADPSAAGAPAATMERGGRRFGPALPVPDFGPTDTVRGWVITGVVTLIALVTRFWSLGSASDGGTPIFDEKHYAPQSFQVSQLGIEENPAYGLVVHPPVAKQVESIGAWIFGYTPMGWRFTAAIAGVLVITLIVRITRRLTRSSWLGGLAGLLLCCDGVLFVTSRVGMLDIYQVLFVTAAAACFLADRDAMRERMHSAALAGRIRSLVAGDARDDEPVVGLRWFAVVVVLGVLGVMAVGVVTLSGGVSFGALAAIVAAAAAVTAVCLYLLRASHGGRLPVADLGPRLGFRWWRFAGGAMLGLAMGVKWSGLYYVAFFGVLVVCFDIALRARYKVKAPVLGMLLRDAVPAFASIVVWPAILYMLSWLPWFADENSVYRHAAPAKVDPGGLASLLPDSVRSWIYYQSSVMDFHSSLTNSNGNMHPWESKPWTWPMSLRPMLYFLEQGQDVQGCGQNECVRAIMLNGTPAMWWLAIPVLAFALWRAVFCRDGRYAFALVGYAAGILPWFFMFDRQMYFFYGALLIPFFVIMLAMILGELAGLLRAGRRLSPVEAADLRLGEALRARAVGRGGAEEAGRVRGVGGIGVALQSLTPRRIVGIAIVAVYVALVVLNFVYMWPVLTGEPITQAAWHNQQWLPSWS